MKTTMLIGATLFALIACGDETTETYARLAAYSNMWTTSSFDVAYGRMMTGELLRLRKTDAVRTGVERWMVDVLGYHEGDSARGVAERILKKNKLLKLTSDDGLCDVTHIGDSIVDYVGRLHNVEESAAALVAAAYAAGGFRPGLRASTDEESLLDAAQYVRESMLPRIGQYWRSIPDESKAACRSNIVERARLTEAEAHTVFGD